VFFVNKPLTTSQMTRSFCANKLADRTTRTRPPRLSDGKRTKASLSLSRFKNLFYNKPLPWPSDANLLLLNTFHVVCSPFIHSLTGEELLIVIVSLSCFEIHECFTSFDMSMFWLAFRIY
jgi:hypothetical protein